MNNKIYTPMKLLMAAFLVLVCAQTLADSHKTETLSEVFVINVKPGKGDEVAKAIKAHMEHRKSLKDPWNWQVFTPVFGNNLNSFLVRAYGFTWADIDKYDEWEKQNNPVEHWNQQVGDNVMSYGHSMAVDDTANSNWGPEVEFNYVWVNSYKVKLGHWSAMMEDRKQFADLARKANWPYNWSWHDDVAGENYVHVAIAYKNYAAMAAPEESFAEMIGRTLKSEKKAKKLLERWSSHFESRSSQLYKRHAKLSM